MVCMIHTAACVKSGGGREDIFVCIFASSRVHDLWKVRGEIDSVLSPWRRIFFTQPRVLPASPVPLPLKERHKP